MKPDDTAISARLLSLDFMRGLIMVLLAVEASRLYDHLYEMSEGGALEGVFKQFFHHPWHGLRFWDLIQPGFMFIAGTSMAFSVRKQAQQGKTWNESFRKALRRSGWLFFWGVLDYAVRPSGLSFELWDVLTQLSFTMLIAFLVFRMSIGAQVGISLGLLLLTEILYRFTQVPGFDMPFTDQHNFGNYVDLLLMNKINPGGWVAINCIPTAAHTIWGALAGKLLLSDSSQRDKIKWLIISGITCLVAGYLLDLTITPIIKRIATTSFVFASGGWCLLGLAACYGVIDVMGRRNKLEFFTIVGMNSIFIYLFFEIVGARWFNGYVSAIAGELMTMIGISAPIMLILSSVCICGLEWMMCWWLWRRRIFFKL